VGVVFGNGSLIQVAAADRGRLVGGEDRDQLDEAAVGFGSRAGMRPVSGVVVEIDPILVPRPA
jgi:hypothetical protein